MPAWFWLSLYCVLIPAVSLVGGWIPLLVKLTHRRMQIAISFVSGVMLGVALLHLLPHAVLEGQKAAGGSVDHSLMTVLGWLVGGVLRCSSSNGSSPFINMMPRTTKQTATRRAT